LPSEKFPLISDSTARAALPTHRRMPANDRIDCSLLVSEFRFRTEIALPIATLELNFLMNL
jgi:hypothetical protein